MIITRHPCLIMHYAPGLLAILRREPCPGRLAGKIGNQVKHGSNCGCNKSRQIFTFVSASEVLDDEKSECLELSWWPK